MDVNAILHALDKYPCIGYNLQAYISSTGNIYLVDPDLSPPQTHDNTTCTQFRKKARAKLRDILDIFVPIRWKSSYKGRAFREYHERIEEKIQTTYLPHRDVQHRSYELPAYEGEFDELRVGSLGILLEPTLCFEYLWISRDKIYVLLQSKPQNHFWSKGVSSSTERKPSQLVDAAHSRFLS